MRQDDDTMEKEGIRMEKETGLKLSPETRRGLQLAGIFLCMIIGLFITLKFALFVMPFTIALIISQILEPLVRVIVKKTPLKRGLVSVLVSILFFALIVFLLILGINKLFTELIALSENLPTDWEATMNEFRSIFDNFKTKLTFLPADNTFSFDDFMERAYTIVLNLSQTILKGVANYATAIPNIFLSTIMSIVATVLLLANRDKIGNFFRNQVSEKCIGQVKGIRGDLLFALVGYIKAQLKIMAVVFVELFIGFTIVGNRYAFLIALGTAVLDALPVFGAGAVLIPSTIWGILIGDYRWAIGCGVMYVCTIIIRQMLEPKMIGQGIGINPLLTLMSMYIGFKVFGLGGFIIGPIFVLILKNLITGYMDGRTIGEYIEGKAGAHHIDEFLEQELFDETSD